MTDFNLLRARSDGQLFLHVHTEQTTFVVAVEFDELRELGERLDEPPETFDR